MALPERVQERIDNHAWPRQVGKTRLVIPPSFGRTVIGRNFRYPDGKILEFQSWHALSPKNRASMVLPITADGLVIAVLQYCHAAARVMVEIPGGVRDTEEESDLEAAIKELREETGFEAEEIIDLGIVYFEPHNLTPDYHAFLGLGCRKVVAPKLDATESLLVETFRWDEWMDICRDPKLVRDSKSLAVTFLAMPILQEHGLI